MWRVRELLCQLPARRRPRLRWRDLYWGYRHRLGGRHRRRGGRRRLQRPLYWVFALCQRLPREDRHPVDQHRRTGPPESPAPTPSEFAFLVEGLTPDAEGTVRRSETPVRQLRDARETRAARPRRSRTGDVVPGSGPLDGPTFGVAAERDLPDLQTRDAREWFDSRRPRAPNPTANRTAVLYPDVYTNYVSSSAGRPPSARSKPSASTSNSPNPARERARAALSGHDNHGDRARRGRLGGPRALPRRRASTWSLSNPRDLAMFRARVREVRPRRVRAALREQLRRLEYVYGLLDDGANPTTSLRERRRSPTTATASSAPSGSKPTPRRCSTNSASTS